MANNFSVSNCVYDGSSGGSGNPNPLCWIYGQVNRKPVYAVAFFAYLAAANLAGQMQQALTAVVFNWYALVYGYSFTPIPTPLALPTFPPTNVAATQSTGPYPVPPVVYSPALIGSWSA